MSHRQTGDRPLVSFVHKPGCLMKKAVLESACLGLEVAEPLASVEAVSVGVAT